MTEQPATRRMRVPRGTTLLPAAALVLLAIGVLWPHDPSGLPLGRAGESRADAFRAALDGLPADAIVLVSFDADLGTYPEVAYAVRATLDELAARGSRLVFVSFAAEGRAVATAEIERVRADAGLTQNDILDLGYRAGAEAALARSVDALLRDGAEGPIADALRERGGGIGAVDAVLIVGGNELGPRTWIEQVEPRLAADGRPAILAIAPAFLFPELEPYRASGQLSGLLANARDAAAYAAGSPDVAEPGARLPSEPAIVVGLLGALAWLGWSAVWPIGERRRAEPGRGGP